GRRASEVSADKAGRASYTAAPEVAESVSALTAAQTITVSTHAPPTAVYGTSFGVAASAPGGTVAFSNSGGCSNSVATFTMTSGTATCPVKYDQAGDANYNAAPTSAEPR